MAVTRKPIPTIVILAKFSNGFMNGFIFDHYYKTNIEDKDVELFDPEFIFAVWNSGAAFGKHHRASRNN